MSIVSNTGPLIALAKLDTITDFVNYLTRKERFISSGKLASAAGEEELLAFYLKDINEQQGHDFIIPPAIHDVTIEEGRWEDFCNSPERRAQLAADEVSYGWDALIEAFNTHILAGTQYFSNIPDTDRDKVMRFLRENHVRDAVCLLVHYTS
jgi:hypothetical protein